MLHAPFGSTWNLSALFASKYSEFEFSTCFCQDCVRILNTVLCTSDCLYVTLLAHEHSVEIFPSPFRSIASKFSTRYSPIILPCIWPASGVCSYECTFVAFQNSSFVVCILNCTVEEDNPGYQRLLPSERSEKNINSTGCYSVNYQYVCTEAIAVWICSFCVACVLFES